MAVQFRLMKEGEEHSVLWDVMIPVPVDGGVEKQLLRVRFRVVGEKAFDTLMDSNPSKASVLRDVMPAIVDVAQDGHGREVAVAADIFALMMDRLYVRDALFDAWLECIRGRAVKN
jgi:hypothetical protein